jgi:hypothetical protein
VASLKEEPSTPKTASLPHSYFFMKTPMVVDIKEEERRVDADWEEVEVAKPSRGKAMERKKVGKVNFSKF